MSRNKNRQLNQQLTEVGKMTQDTHDQDQVAAPVQEASEDSAQETQQPEHQQEAQQETPTEEKDVESVKSEASHQPNKEERFTPVYKVELDLTGYAEAMDMKKAIVPEEGGRWQYSLFTSIKSVLNTADQTQFNKEWNTVLNFFNKNKEGVFNEKFLFRFAEHWPGSSTEYTTARRLLYTLIQTADPKTRRAALASIKLDMVTEGLNEAQRGRLLNFYGA